MYDNSEDALADNRTLSLDVAKAELRRHGCRVLDWAANMRGVKIQVTNDLDDPEWIDSTPRSILIWLGY